MKTEKLKEDIQKLSQGCFPDDKEAYGKLIGDLGEMKKRSSICLKRQERLQL